MTEHVVTKTDLEAKLKEIENFVTKRGNPEYGLFGPGSMMWKVGSESIIFFGSGYALLMQEAHPWVATGAYQHSKVKTDPMGRWKRTFSAVNTLIFGDLNSAMKCARMIHAIHSKVKGTLDEHGGGQYAANNENALMWVAATLCYTSIRMYELGVSAMTYEEKNQYYQEFKRFCYMFGISDETLPRTWDDFTGYYTYMTYCKQLSVKEHGRELISHFTSKYENPFHPLHIPSDVFLMITGNLLPRSITKQYGIKFGFKEELISDAIILAVRNLYGKLPKEVRMNPYYRQATKKLSL